MDFMSTNFDNIVDNLFLVEASDVKYRFGWDVITELLTLGNDTDDFRRNFGIYEDRKAYYSKIPTDYEYKHRLSDPAQRVIDRKDRTVFPWAVRPGKWIFVPDFMPGFIPPNTNLRSDPRWKFLEVCALQCSIHIGFVRRQVRQAFTNAGKADIHWRFSVSQEVNPQLIENLATHFPLSRSIATAWGNVVSNFLLLRNLRCFYPFTSVNENGDVYDLSGQGRVLTNNNVVPFASASLSTYADYTPATLHFFDRIDEAGFDVAGNLTFGGWFWFERVGRKCVHDE